MKFSEEHTSIQKALIVAAKFGFIRKETFWNYLTTSNISYKYDLWNRLMKTDYLKKYDRVGVAENYYCLTKKGYSVLSDYGLEPVAKAHPLHFEHDEVILNFALSNEKNSLVKSNWMTERSLKQLNSYQQIEFTGHSLDKIPDLIFEINTRKLKLLSALEVERTRKSKIKYDSIVLSYSRYDKMKLIFILYKDEYVRRSILESIKRLGYPQNLRPFIFGKIADVLKNANEFKIELNGASLSFDQYVRNLRQLEMNSSEESAENYSGLNSVKMNQAA